MDLRHDVKSITYLKNHAAELISTICEEGRTVTITQNGASKVVVMEVERFERMNRVLMMAKLVEVGRAEAAAGRVRPQSDVFERLTRELDEALPSTDG